MVGRIIARRNELKNELEASRGKHLVRELEFLEVTLPSSCSWTLRLRVATRRDNEETGGTPEEAGPEVLPRPNEAHVSPAARESSVRASELSALNDRESDREN
ncbi:hypothetical protein F2Q70_00035590 [Brassica cretica]|uniref:Uncharacterized protein n=1 Tax=Brassica cretica TaxID=69181 RepID=A0A8S9JT37_BRACR|nr:hypothetical protein F2Q70_00035590 [Brassica cretica]